MKLNVKEIQRRIGLTGLTNWDWAKQNGIWPQLLQAWMSGCHRPNLASRKRLAKALNCQVEDIEQDDTPQVMFGDADAAIKAFCAAVEKEMDSRTELTKISCLTKDCPYRDFPNFICNAKSIIIQNGQCMTGKRVMEEKQ